MNTSPGTKGQAVVNEIASWSEAELDARVAAAFAKVEEPKSRAAVAVVREDGYMVGLADRCVAGYTPTTYEYDTYEEANAVAKAMNEQWGLTPLEAAEIALSTMKLGR